MFVKIAQKVTKYFGYFCVKFCHQDLSINNPNWSHCLHVIKKAVMEQVKISAPSLPNDWRRPSIDMISKSFWTNESIDH